jgi:glutathione S-transferase
MKLYYAPGACSLSPHIALREAGIPFTLEKVDLGTKKTAAGKNFVTINPKGYVPALELDGGEVLTEGPAIVQYIADLKPASKLAPAAGTLARVRVQEALNFISTELHKQFGPLFSKTSSPDAKQTATANIGKRFGHVEQTLADGRQFLTGDTFTVADGYLFTVAGWGKYTGIDLGAWPRVKALVERIGKRPAVQEAMRAEGLI